ncbi:MAG TPA: L,D-transpeptidase [Anaerolineales bacterium]|nr:L,D-transpeptidase [Anaerolineales bacterium]
MKKISSLVFALAVLISANMQRPVSAHTESESESGAVLCAPDVYLVDPGDCLPLGPSNYLAELSQLGLTIPPRPLASKHPDLSLTQLPYFYFHLDNDLVPILNGPAGAETGNAYMPGFVYVSYVDRVDTGHGIYYMLQDGSWIRGKGSRVSEISSYQGLEFTATPKRPFGWAFEYIPIKQTPGYSAPETGNFINPFAELIQVYQTQNVDGADWNMIGPNQWVEARKVAIVTPNTSPPAGVTTGRWIDVDLAEQTLAVYDNFEIVFATVIASGLEPFWTRPGTFQIYLKKETENMRNNDPTDFYYLDNVPWTMYFDKARALHGAYWRTRFGYPQSHGCVNLSVGDAHWLYNWANEGDWVYVHDPSGLTPTDPALYHDWAY